MSKTPAASDRTEDVDVLARTIWGEARGESRAGREAVACVVMNRARIALAHWRRKRSRYWWGKTPSEICRKHAQFSCWLQSDPNRTRMLAVTAEDPVFAECLEIARQAIAGELPDRTNGATHYINARLASPKWARGETSTAVIDHHTFYRLV